MYMYMYVYECKPADYITNYKMIRHSYMNNINNIVEVTLFNKQFITDDCFITVGCFFVVHNQHLCFVMQQYCYSSIINH